MDNGASKLQAVAERKSQSLTALSGTKYTREQVELLKRTVCKGATDDELKLFLHVAERSGLDPFARQIHAVRRWNSDINGYVMVTQTGVDGYRLIAERTGKYAPGKEPSFQYDQDGKLVSATAYVMKQVGDRWFEVGATARFEEYVAKKKDGSPNSMWAGKPHIMIAKCAEALALRRCFPADLSGIYLEEEVEAANATAPAVVQDRSSSADKPMTKAEIDYFMGEIGKSGMDTKTVQRYTQDQFGKLKASDLTKSQADQVLHWIKELNEGSQDVEPADAAS
jgi:phage recombination protein Bet